MRRSARLTVFEAINRARGEIYIGATPHAMHALIAGFRRTPPPEISDWAPDEVDYRSLAFDLDVESAAAFIRSYAAAQAGWKIVKREIVDP